MVREAPTAGQRGGDARWAEQCGGCCYYIPLVGSIGADWGGCSNGRSPQDRTVVFEHYGCSKHSRVAVKVYFGTRQNSPQGWMRTRTVEETLELLGSRDVTHLSLEGSGEPVLRWIDRAVRENGFEAPEITIHSTDPAERARLDAAVQQIIGLCQRGEKQRRRERG